MPPGRTINIYPDTGPGVSQSGQSSSSSSQSSQSSQPQTQTTQVQAGGQTGTTVEPEEPEETVEVEETTYSRPLSAVPDIYYDELMGAVRKRGETLYTVQVDDARGILKAKDVQFTVTKVKRTRPDRVTIGRPPGSYKEQPPGLEAAKKFNGIDFTPGGATKVIKEDVEAFWRSLPAIPDILYSGHIEGAVRKKGGTIYQATKGGATTAFITAWDTPVVKKTLELYPQGIIPASQLAEAKEAYQQLLKSTKQEPTLNIMKPSGTSPSNSNGSAGKEESAFDLFIESWFEASPWGWFTKEGIPKADKLSGKKKVAVYAGQTLGELSKVGAYLLGGELVGAGAGAVASSRVGLGLRSAAEPLIWRITNSPLAGQGVQAAARGTLKGLAYGGIGVLEYLKAKNMLDARYGKAQTALDIAGDLASVWSFMKGFQLGFGRTYRPPSTKNTDIIIERQSPEGTIIETHKIRNGVYTEGQKLVQRSTGRMDYLTLSKYKPDVGYVVAGKGEGVRDVEFLLAEGPKASMAPGREVVFDATNPDKYWKYAQGGRRLFYLYDPVKGGLEQIPRIPSELKSLIGTAKVKPTTPQTLLPSGLKPWVLAPPFIPGTLVQGGGKAITQELTTTTSTKSGTTKEITTLDRTHLQIRPQTQIEEEDISIIPPSISPPIGVTLRNTDTWPLIQIPNKISTSGDGESGSRNTLITGVIGGTFVDTDDWDRIQTQTQIQTQIQTQTQTEVQTQTETQTQDEVITLIPSSLLIPITIQTSKQEQLLPVPPKPPKSTLLKPPKPPLIIPGRKGKGVLPSFGALFKRSWASYVGYESLLSPRRSGKKSRKSKRPSMPKRPRLVPPKLPKFSPPRLLPGR